MFWFLQNEDGTELDGRVLTKIRAEAKIIWRELCDKYGPIGCPWSSVAPRYQREYWRRIEAAYPVLRLCDGHYKADSIPFSDYSHWYDVRYPDPDNEPKARGRTRKRSRTATPALGRKVRHRSLRSDPVLQPQDGDEDTHDHPPSVPTHSPPPRRPAPRPKPRRSRVPSTSPSSSDSASNVPLSVHPPTSPMPSSVPTATESSKTLTPPEGENPASTITPSGQTGLLKHTATPTQSGGTQASIVRIFIQCVVLHN